MSQCYFVVPDMSQVCFFIFGYFLPLLLIICLYSVMINRLLAQVNLCQWKLYIFVRSANFIKSWSLSVWWIFFTWTNIWRASMSMIIMVVIHRPELAAPALSRWGTRKGWEFHFYFQLLKNHPHLSYFQLVKLQNLPQFVKLKICFHFMKLKFLFSVLCETYFFLKACLHCENWQVTKVNTFCSLWN